jgi:hypothetical protein
MRCVRARFASGFEAAHCIAALRSLTTDVAASREPLERITEAIERERSANVVVCNRILGHRRMLGLGRLLYEADSAPVVDVHQAPHPIIARACENDAHGA